MADFMYSTGSFALVRIPLPLYATNILAGFEANPSKTIREVEATVFRHTQ